MRGSTEERKPPEGTVLGFRILWPFLLLLAGFILFFEVIADAGGSSLPVPPASGAPLSSPESNRLP